MLRASRAFVRVLLVVVAFTAGVLTTAAGPERLAGLVALQGTWVLDPERTPEDVDPYDQAQRPRRRAIFGPGPSGPLTGPGMGGPMTGGRRTAPDPSDMSRLRHLADVALDDEDDLEIAVAGETVTITAGSYVQTLRADGEKRMEVTPRGLELERKTKWDDGKLVTEFKVKGGGGKGKQTWTPEGGTLVVATEIETDQSPGRFKMRRVYDRELPVEP